MRWKIESTEQSSISGWVYAPSALERVFEVMAVHGNSILARAMADEQRESLIDKGHKPACGFTLPLPNGCDVSSVQIIALDVHDGQDLIIHSSQKESIGKLRGSYQNFAEDKHPGDSLSQQKWENLALPDLRGKAVLDIGCNEGFFSMACIMHGARRVVGVDQGSWFIEKAKRRVPDYPELAKQGRLELRTGSWWKLPDERFDIILFLSAIHYEKNQKALLEYLATRLAPGGVLVLECGSLRMPGRFTLPIQRSIDVCSYPTTDYLLSTLLCSYSVRYVAESVAQKGDPIPRAVYHCTPKRPTVLLIRGVSGSGKSTLSRMISDRSIPVFSTDHFLTLYRNMPEARMPRTPLFDKVYKKLTGATLNRAYSLLAANQLIESFCQTLADCLPLEEELCVLEGEVLCHQPVFDALVRELETRGILVWDAARPGI